MKKFAIHTLGCKTNQLESAKIVDDFNHLGWKLVDFKDAADLYIINSCTVTAKADNESIYFARKAKRTNPNSKVILTGCYAQISKDEAALLEEVDLIVGNSLKYSIPRIVSSRKDVFNSANKILVTDIFEESDFIYEEVKILSGKTRANIKVQDGCNNRCAYCIIPYARGKSRSNSLNNIIEQITQLTLNGYKEVVLTGIHLGQWGLDLTPKLEFPKLLVEIEKVPMLTRFRMGSLYPNEITSKLLNVLSNSKKFCHHIHLSLQSVDDEILTAMNRNYTFEKIAEVVTALKTLFPDIFIGCDIITGFPGESEQHFKRTYENLKQLPLSSIHVFPYSRRKGTPAYDMPEQIPEHLKKERSKILNELAEEKLAEFKQGQLNKVHQVIIEKTRHKKTGMLKALTGNYIPVLIDASDELKGEVRNVKLSEINDLGIIGEIAN